MVIWPSLCGRCQEAVWRWDYFLSCNCFFAVFLLLFKVCQMQLSFYILLFGKFGLQCFFVFLWPNLWELEMECIYSAFIYSHNQSHSLSIRSAFTISHHSHPTSAAVRRNLGFSVLPKKFWQADDNSLGIEPPILLLVDDPLLSHTYQLWKWIMVHIYLCILLRMKSKSHQGLNKHIINLNECPIAQHILHDPMKHNFIPQQAAPS